MGFNDFIRERRYLNNVSASTISWYAHDLKFLPNESPSQAELKEVVLRMREKGLKATGCNMQQSERSMPTSTGTVLQGNGSAVPVVSTCIFRS